MSISSLLASLPEPIVDMIVNFPAIAASDFGRYLIAAPVMAAIVWILKKTVWGYRQIQPRLASSADYRREFLASLRTCLVFSMSGFVVAIGLTFGIMQEIDLSFGLWTDVALFALIILVHDAYFYWTHRMMHHPKLFKSFHRLHHRSITPTPFAAYAFATPEAIVMAAFMPLWLMVVPTSVTVISAFLLVMIIRNVMGHAGLELHARWWLKTPLTRWISTTTHHDLHHSGSFKHNFGFYFTYWDKICGTEHPEYAAEFAKSVAKPDPEERPAQPAMAYAKR